MLRFARLGGNCENPVAHDGAVLPRGFEDGGVNNLASMVADDNCVVDGPASLC